ncbi:MAG: nitroreductase family protein [Chloroflexi bacterium]|nr:nitroreductase family protein [Chloroflexota bacterium]
MELADLAKLIKSRRSIRTWQDKPVPRELLVQAVELATWAPNGGNQQNWRFYIILNRNTIKAIADVVHASVDKLASWPESKQFVDDAARWRRGVTFFSSAPACIAVASKQYQSATDLILAARPDDPEAVEMRLWRNTASSRTQSAAAAVAYLLLILHQMGLGTTWMTGPMQAKGKIEKILGVPPDMDLLTFIPVGYPAESSSKDRLPVEKVCEVIS